MAHSQHTVALAPACEPVVPRTGGLSPQRVRRVKQLILDRLGESLEVTELAQACFQFLPWRAELDLAGWPEVDIFAHA